jgi:hypothetical protein
VGGFELNYFFNFKIIASSYPTGENRSAELDRDISAKKIKIVKK